MKYLLLAALLIGLIVPGSATSAQDKGGIAGMIVGKEAGIVTIPSNHSVDETVDRLRNILRSKEVTLFALIDHSGRSGQGGNENASYEATDLRQSERRHPSNAGRSERCSGPTSGRF